MEAERDAVIHPPEAYDTASKWQSWDLNPRV